MQVIYRHGPGWGPITWLAQLAAELMDGQIVSPPVARKGLRKYSKLRSWVWGRRRRGRQPHLLICRRPAEIQSLVEFARSLPTWNLGGPTAVWIIDSFWYEHVPARTLKRQCDHLFTTFHEDVEYWQRRAGKPVGCLPWGSDVLRLGGDRADRPVDVQRIGRQPPEWDDDIKTAHELRRMGLSFAGRVPHVNSPLEGHRKLMGEYAKAKYMLAFSNTVDGSSYTHPDRAYITARWTDALAAGSVVAGVLPESETTQSLLWPEANLDLGSTRFEIGAEILRRSVKTWTAAHATLNYKMALKRLDWRWRIQSIAEVLGGRFPKLDRELEILRTKIMALDAKAGDARVMPCRAPGPASSDRVPGMRTERT